MQGKIDLEKIERSSDCISGYDKDLNIKVWNEALAQKYRIPKENAIGKNLLEVFPHIKDDFRVKCFVESIQDNKSFFFSSLPFLYEDGLYSQLIVPVKEYEELNVLSLVREHIQNERFLRGDLLKTIMSP